MTDVDRPRAETRAAEREMDNHKLRSCVTALETELAETADSLVAAHRDMMSMIHQ